MEKQISIIIPVWNVEQYVEECLSSVAKQQLWEGATVECIIVDDCGTDSSIKIAEDFIDSHDGNIEFKIEYSEKNGGLSAARNRGIRKANGKYLYFLDSDDKITDNCIKLLYETTLRYPNAQIINGDYEMFPENLRLNQPGLRDFHELPEYLGTHKDVAPFWFNIIPVAAWNKLIRKDFILKHQLFFREKIIFEDNHWKIQMFPHIESIAFVNQITYLYRMRPDSIMHDAQYSIKRDKNLGDIYYEFFSQDIPQERDFYKWIFTSLSNMKFSKTDISQVIYKKLIDTLLSNKTLSNKIKLLVCYHKLRRPFMRVTIIDKLLNVI